MIIESKEEILKKEDSFYEKKSIIKYFSRSFSSQRICRMRKQTEDNSQSAADNSTTPATEAAAEESTEATGGTVESKGTITVAASATPHAEILAAAKPILAEQGWDLEVTEFDDYVLPNEVVESGEMDANYFQHVPYLDSFNEEKGNSL